jgi:hypothetical protein
MKHVLIVLSGVLALYCSACTSSGKNTTINVPPAPVSVASTHKLLKGKEYVVEELGLLSPFPGDTTITWMKDNKDTSSFFKNFQQERMAYTLHLLNDTAYESMDEGRLQKGTYTIDNENRPGIMSSDAPEEPGTKLRLTTNDVELGTITNTMVIKGIDENALLLTLNRDFNRRKVVVLMKEKQ